MNTSPSSSPSLPPSFLILPAELARLHEARKLQVERYRVAYLEKHGALPKEGEGLAYLTTDASQVAISLAGREILIRIGLLVAWARTLDVAKPLILVLCPNGNLIVKHAKGQLRLFTLSIVREPSGTPYISSTYGSNWPVEFDVIPLDVNVPAGTLTALIPTDSTGTPADLKAMKAETTKARKAEARAKALVRARKAEKLALEKLMEEKEKAEAAQAVLDGQSLSDAIAFARRVRQARRDWRADMVTPEIRPAWLPSTYVVFGARWDEEKRMMETYPAETADAFAEYDGLRTSYVNARAARRGYRPKMRWPCWATAKDKRNDPSLGVPVYGPTYDKLKEAEDKALSNLKTFLRERFDEWCATQGLPKSLTYEWLPDEARPYSCARLTVRQWGAGIKDELTTGYEVAKAARERIERGDKAED